MQEFKTIKAGCEPLGTYAEKSSKFIAYLSRATCKSEAQTYIEQKRAEHPHARHVCSAWLLPEGISHVSDDGEPSKTAGIPILSVLQHYELHACVGVVVRYFGGILLGTGVLKRAYSTAIEKACEDACMQKQLVSMGIVENLVLSCSYALYGSVQSCIARYQGTIADTLFETSIQVTVRFIAQDERAKRCLEELKDLSCGQIDGFITDRYIHEI
ncbi:YigZ family protein [Fannyhessea vaginae]|uniref:IMPACT family protein n=1 Tax=Fannyhessea vaginae TaxID=82135 RepID=UPI0026EBC49A|nr:YigZ family protein [Fannyhessea vaginae]